MMSINNIFLTTTIAIALGIFIGLLLAKIQLKVTWKQLIIIKYKVLIIAPMINVASKLRLNKIRSRLENILFN